MELKEILQLLQAREITPEDAIKKSAQKPITIPQQSMGILSSNNIKESIAIIGMSGRYPGACELNQYWENLVQGKNLIREIPDYLWDMNKYYDPRLYQKGKIYCKWIGLLEGIEYFDPLFFNISPAEAEVMDPQHRIFLQEGYKVFEDAGYSRQLLSNKKCGVYLGIMNNEYSILLFRNKAELSNLTGNSSSIAVARISYFLNLKGPAIPIDTACSSSLVATHLACQALLDHEIDMALVGGVSLYLIPESYIGMCEAGMLSPDGQCKAFDNSANGLVPGEGVGALVLKRLKDAEADNDNIYGVIIGSGINQDGKTNGITAPSVNSQIALEREIYDKYKIPPESISYVEMHGTGTKLGDPIELEALATVYKERTNQKNYCAVGSVKSNIGHTSAAAGMASIHKVLLCMRHKKLVPTLNFKKPNEHFNFEDSPFFVNTKLQPWKSAPGTSRRAGVSSFGYSGTNAHLVIEEYLPKIAPGVPVVINSNNPVLFVLSAKSKEQLKLYAQSMKNYLESHEELNLTEVAYTLQVGREAMEHRLAFLANSKEEILTALKRFIDNISPEGVFYAQVIKNQNGVGVFETDKSANSLLQTYLQTGKLNELAELWVKGLDFDWNQLYGKIKPHRASLPTYPFARECYWFSKARIKSDDTITSPATTGFNPSQNTEKMILIKDWQPKTVETNSDIQAGVVVILGTAGTARLTAELFEDMEAIQTIPVFYDKTNSSTQGIASDYYSVSAGEHLYQQIKQWQKQSGQRFLGVIDVTAYDDVYEQSVDLEYGKIAFLQKLIEHHRNKSYKLLQVTHQLHTFQLVKTSMKGARLAGLYRMLGAEYKQVESMTMDCECTIQDCEKLAKQIQAEFLNKDREKLSECCYRNDERYEPKLVVAQTNEDIIKGCYIPERFEKNDVILITGGSRGIGASIAEHIVSQGVKNLVIMGRENLPASPEWRKIIENQGRPEIEEKLKRMQSLIDQGVRVHYYSISLTDQEGLSAIVHKVHHDMGPITGIFHCAGLTSKNPAFFKKSLPDIEKVCEPKVKGLRILHKAFEKEPLAFFILFSSISSIAPKLAAGQSDYAMANAYMDYYALHQTGQGKFYFKAIQWPAWGETGMGQRGMPISAYRKTGLVPHTTADGLTFLDLIKKTHHTVSLPCVAVPGEFSYDQLLKTEIIPLKKEFDISFPEASGFRPKVSPIQDPQADFRAAVIGWLQNIFISELKLTVEQLDDVDKPLDEYGVDSIIFAQLTQKMQERINKTLDPSLLFQYSSIVTLADYFIANHTEDLQKNLDLEIGKTPENSFKKNGILAINEPSQIVNTGFRSKHKPILVKYSKTLNKPAQPEDDIAVVGMSCRFPGSSAKEAYWDLLTKSVSSIKPLSENRWALRNNCTDYGGWVDDIDLFDPEYFHIKEEDAAIMDPQARMILEESLKVIYDAGYEHKQLSGAKIGVYIGGRSQPNMNVNAVLKAPNPILGAGQNYLATNISRFFNFNGPSLVIDTACSSGIAGMSFAVDSLLKKSIDMALVGAVNLLLNPVTFNIFAARNILSKNGEFHIFDKRSSGEVLGEGAGIVILKRLSNAIKDGNHIYGVIKAISVNNDGRTIGPGSPNINTQKQVMRDALVSSGKQPEDIGYIEVNGGGSPVVDSIEIKALSDIYRLDNQELTSCFIGSVKPNIGHLLLASGLAGFIRCVLSVYHKQIPPFLSAFNPFEHYDFAASRIHFNREITDWKVDPGKRRIAALNSFPDGGTNCHVIIEEFIPDGCFQQRYFPGTAPYISKKRFPLPTLFWGEAFSTLQSTDLSEENAEIDMSEFKRIFKKQPEKEAEQQHLTRKNIWGEIR